MRMYFRLRYIFIIIFPVAIPFAVFLFHSLLFYDWIVDDAGITFSYSRNLSNGDGLVSQPGSMPVEGFSNFTWVLILAPLFLFYINDPQVIIKIISNLLILATFITLYVTFNKIGKRKKTVAFITLLLLSVNTSFVVWTTSGLENPLYVLLISLLFYFFIVFCREETGTTIYLPCIIGIIVSLIAMTRPEGILFVSTFPVLLLVVLFFYEGQMKRTVYNLLIYFIPIIFLYGGFVYFRYLYFHDIHPNTYYAKGGPDFENLKSLLLIKSEILIKAGEVFTGGIPRIGTILFLGLIGVTGYQIGLRKMQKEIIVLLIFLAVSLVCFLLLPNDWMGEFRFATPFFVFFYGSLIIFADRLINIWSGGILRKSLIVLLVAMFVGISLVPFVGRTTEFKNSPTISFKEVSEKARLFNDFASEFEISEASVLSPDIGGLLFYSELKVIDLAGLTDKKIAESFGRSRREENNSPGFYEYIFETVKPSFIYIHSDWSYAADFDSDLRFRRDYVGALEYLDEKIEKNTGLKMYSGIYIRKELINGKEGEYGKLVENFYSTD